MSAFQDGLAEYLTLEQQAELRARVELVLLGGIAPELTVGQRLDLPRGPKAMRAFANSLLSPPGLSMQRSLRALALAREDIVMLEWLARVEIALNANIYDALGHLDVGDVDGAIAAFNARVSMRLSSVSRNADSTHTWTFVGGPEIIVDLERTRVSLLLMPHVPLPSSKPCLLH